MKRLATYIAASCLLTLVAPNVAHAEWVEVYRDSSTAMDVQENLVESKGNGIVAYISRSRLRAKGIDGAKTYLIEGLIDCENQAYLFSRGAGFNQSGEAIFGGNLDRQWRLIPTGSRQSAIASHVCQISQ
ncbi:hypothetical protein [Merismopedia glauca]|uniref:Uncharacterized protein n=1 Tax=Merismopedia glauca CCAP 1448/3 TaxID=1296344 RepID=A0A2T1C4P2_9CYAN|nr:hypothetical protein [Merismopedia glauca]PSB03194.1 hypothetical protein C7B64_09600 [Merismopedia glauca CCAP 1448/3]